MTLLERLPLDQLAEAVVIDTETTGLGSNDEIVSFAAINMANRLVFYTLINPSCRISEEATAIHGINENDLAYAPIFFTVWPAIYRFFREHIVLGYNIAFDLRLIEQSARKNDCDFDVSRVKAHCIMQMAMRRFNSTHRISLPRIREKLGLPPVVHHSADGDARSALEVFRAIRVSPQTHT